MLQKGLFSLLLLLFAAAPALADVVVIVRREAQPSGNYVRVCDIARVDGPDDQAREVAMTVLGPAPTRGETQEITRWDIETRLYEMGVGARVRFTGNDVVRVLGSGAPAGRSAESGFQPLDSLPARRVEPADAAPDMPRPGTGTRLQRRMDERQAAEKPAPAQVEPKPAERRERGLLDLDAEGKTRAAQAIGEYFVDRYRADNAKRADIEVVASVVGATGGIPASAGENPRQGESDALCAG